MRRYTVRLHADQPGANPSVLRQAIERRLLHAPVTYSFGQTSVEDGDTVLEVATDAAPRDFERLLGNAAVEERASTVGISRGWLLSGGRPDDAADPLARVEPQAEGERVYAYNARGWLTLLLSPVVLGAFAVLTCLRAADLVSREAALLAQTATLFGVMALPWRFDFWRLVTRIEVDREGLTLAGPRRRRYAWSDVWGLDLNLPVQATIRTPSGSAGFPLDRSLGLSDQDTLLQTVVERAALRLAETHPPRYRRGDGPD